MKLRNTMVITPKKGQEILGKIVFVELRQRTYDAEVKRNVTPQGFRPVGHENVSGMHVGMKKAVAKDLRKENLDACSAQLAGIDTGRFQSFGLADRDAAHALHGEQDRKSTRLNSSH